jgi:RNA polymerase sigma factor (sigma-70 family)
LGWRAFRSRHDGRATTVAARGGHPGASGSETPGLRRRTLRGIDSTRSSPARAGGVPLPAPALPQPARRRRPLPGDGAEGVRAFGRLDAVANHRAWLYRIAGNTFLSDRRKHGGRDRSPAAVAEALPSPTSDEAARLDARDLLVAVDGLVAGLPKKQRLALVGRKYHDLSYAEIAASLGCSEDAARANVHAALRKLRDALGDRLA